MFGKEVPVVEGQGNETRTKMKEPPIEQRVDAEDLFLLLDIMSCLSCVVHGNLFCVSLTHVRMTQVSLESSAWRQLLISSDFFDLYNAEL